VSALSLLASAVDPELAVHAVPEPGVGELETLIDDPGRGLVLEAVHEGYLMHYREPRAFRGMDDDLRLLAGDALYALGLARLAERGDLEAVAVLSELITRCARAEVEGRGDLVSPLWRESAERLSDRPRRGARRPPGDRPDGSA
jgi:hypothetical protein